MVPASRRLLIKNVRIFDDMRAPDGRSFAARRADNILVIIKDVTVVKRAL